MKRFIKILGLIALATVASNASVDVSAVTLDVRGVEILASIILGALAIIWVARKVVGFLELKREENHEWSEAGAYVDFEDMPKPWYAR